MRQQPVGELMATILIVDDEPAILRELSSFLSKQGHDVLTCQTTSEAWDTISKKSPDVIILDVWFADGYFYEAKSSWTTSAISLNTEASFTKIAPASIQISCPGMPGFIGISGSGTYPSEDIAEVGVIDGEGGYALSQEARVSFSTNVTINPRLGELWECIKRDVGTLQFFTFFAFDPSFLPEANRRVPTAWADKAAVLSFVQDANRESGTQIVPIDATDDNYEIEHVMVSVGGGLYAIKLMIVLTGEWETDEGAQDALIAMYGSSVSGKNANKVLGFVDMTNAASPPWSGTYLDLV